jgi:hypothetical protein
MQRDDAIIKFREVSGADSPRLRPVPCKAGSLRRLRRSHWAALIAVVVSLSLGSRLAQGQPPSKGRPPAEALTSAYASTDLCSFCGPERPPGDGTALRAAPLQVLDGTPGVTCLSPAIGYELKALTFRIYDGDIGTLTLVRLPKGGPNNPSDELMGMAVNLITGEDVTTRVAAAKLPKPLLSRSFLLSMPQQSSESLALCEEMLPNLFEAVRLEATVTTGKTQAGAGFLPSALLPASNLRQAGDGKASNKISCVLKTGRAVGGFCARWILTPLAVYGTACDIKEVGSACIEGDREKITEAIVSCARGGISTYDPSTQSYYCPFWDPPGKNEGECLVRSLSGSGKYCIDPSISESCQEMGQCCELDSGQPGAKTVTDTCTQPFPPDARGYAGKCKPCTPPVKPTTDVGDPNALRCPADQFSCPPSDATLADPKWDKHICCAKAQRCAPNSPRSSCETCPSGGTACGTKCCEAGETCEFSKPGSWVGRCVSASAID